MATKLNRDSANEDLLLRLHENDLYARQLVPVGDCFRRTPRPAAPHIIQLVLRKINADDDTSRPGINDTRGH
jgi:hypothetical protein